MTHANTQWAVASLLQLGHHQLRAHATPSMVVTSSCPKAVRVSAAPRLMRSADGARLCLLARRPNGIAGVELGSGCRVPWQPSACSTAAAPTHSRKSRLLASYLQRRGFETIPATPPLSAAPQAPILLHTNPFIGWKLNQESRAYPLYAHTLAELTRLRGREVLALQPSDCLVASHYTEWENWREVLCEPGWDFFSADDEAVAKMLQEGATAVFRGEGGDEDETVLRKVDILS